MIEFRLVLHKQAAMAGDANVRALNREPGAKGRSFASLFGSRGQFRVSKSPNPDNAGDEDAHHVLDEFPGI